jgi:hypothetical protein
MRPDRTGFARATLTSLTAAVALSVVGCSQQTPTNVSRNPVGSAELNLSLPDNSTITSVSYTVTRTGGFSRSDNVPVGNSQALTFQIGNLPANPGYAMSLSATTSDNQMCSAGPVSFDVAPHNTAVVMMTLRCGGGAAASKSGSVRVDVDVVKGTSCAQVDGLSAIPRSVKVGSDISLRGFATTATASFAWSVVPATGGTFGSANAQNTTFTCANAGTHTVTLAVNGGASCTSDMATIPLICTGASGGAGVGAAGVGVAGVGVAGVGAAGVGAAGVGAAGVGVARSVAPRTGAVGGAVSAECTACRNTNCRNFNGMGVDIVGGCFEAINTTLGAVTPDPSFISDCVALTSCAYRNNCAYGAQGISDCYCGTTTSDLCVMNGPAADAKCVMEVQNATRGTSPKQISTQLANLALPSGWAYFLLQCDKESCASTCVPQ